jgi:hypothetical protein
MRVGVTGSGGQTMARQLAQFLASLALISGCVSIARCEDAPGFQPAAAVETPVDFDKTYRLEFKLVTSESSESFVVLTSQSVFGIRYGVQKDGEEYGFDLAGKLAIVQENERLRVSFKMSIDRTSQDGNGFDLASTGSAIVRLGKTTTVAKYGQYDLKLIATVEKDDDSPSE